MAELAASNHRHDQLHHGWYCLWRGPGWVGVLRMDYLGVTMVHLQTTPLRHETIHATRDESSTVPMEASSMSTMSSP